MLLILLYMLAIGPLDYLIVHKLLKRPRWTWVTFPLMVLLATAVAAATARDRNPEEILANQVDVVDLDAASGQSRLQSWVCFTSPQTERYQIAAQAATRQPAAAGGDFSPTRVCWAGVPETGFRGMYRTGGLDQWKAAYSLAPDQAAILDLPVSLWSSANVAAQAGLQPAAIDQTVEANLVASAGQLRGTLTNQLPVPMNDWFIAHQGRAYVPQTRTAGAAALRIAPGDTLDLDDHRRVVPRVLQSYLTGVRRLQVDQGSDRPGQSVVAVRDTYDPLGRDFYDIWRMVTFYRAARGEEFTTLQNHAFRDLDFSDLLQLDRAVLFCQIETPAVQFTMNESPLETTEHHTILRIVLPVQDQ
jgi:hypothetical protein